MKTLTAKELKQWIDEGRELQLINVLGEEDYRKVHIPDSVNIPVGRDRFVDEVEDLAGGRDETIVVYCSSFDCQASPTAARKLDEAGFTSVYDFEGGIKEWLQAGYPVVREKAQATA